MYSDIHLDVRIQDPEYRTVKRCSGQHGDVVAGTVGSVPIQAFHCGVRTFSLCEYPGFFPRSKDMPVRGTSTSFCPEV